MIKIQLMIRLLSVVGMLFFIPICAEETPSTEKNNATLPLFLGTMYYEGLGVKQDNQTAIKWFTKAAKQGNVDAQLLLGAIYQTGDKVEQNYQTARKWYSEAAKQGNAMAQLSLGAMYKRGQGVEKNNLLAYAWYNQASINGNEIASEFLKILEITMTPSEIAKAKQINPLELEYTIKGQYNEN